MIRAEMVLGIVRLIWRDWQAWQVTRVRASRHTELRFFADTASLLSTATAQGFRNIGGGGKRVRM